MSGGQPRAAAGVRRRPKDRKAQIARASADAFGSQGYHAVSMEEIASRVGITPAALYRHSPSKYDLFRDAVLGLGQLLVDATDFADDLPDDDSRSATEAVVAALVDVTIANRTAGGLYRWEARYLRDPDRATLIEQLDRVNRRLQRPLARMRPTLSPRQRWTLSAAALSVIGSITDHPTPLAANEIRSCFTGMAADLLDAEMSAARRPPIPVRTPLRVGAAAGIYEHVLSEAMRLFSERGYRDTSMEDIATAVGIQASGLYRSFPGKADILALAYRRGADRHSSDLAEIVSETTGPEAALARLVAAYVARAVDFPDLAYVYYTERRNLPESDLWVVDTIEQSMVDAWARLITAVRPKKKMGAARYSVRAAFALSVDLGRLAGLDTRPDSAETMRRLMEVALLGRPAAGHRDATDADQNDSSKSR